MSSPTQVEGGHSLYMESLTNLWYEHLHAIIPSLFNPCAEPTFHMPTEAKEMTPEKFHDFLSLASSPPLPSSSPPHPLATTPRSHQPHQIRERMRQVSGDGGSREGSVENDDVPSAPSFAQVS